MTRNERETDRTQNTRLAAVEEVLWGNSAKGEDGLVKKTERLMAFCYRASGAIVIIGIAGTVLSIVQILKSLGAW